MSSQDGGACPGRDSALREVRRADDRAALDACLDRLFDTPPAREVWIRPVVEQVLLYGAGGLGQLALRLLAKAGAQPEAFVDLYAAVTEIAGIPVLRPEQVEAATRIRCTILVCVVTSAYVPIHNLLVGLGFADVRPFYDAAEYLIDRLHITNGWYAPPLDDEDARGVALIYAGLADDASRAAYMQALSWRVRREELVSCLADVNMVDKWFPAGIMPPLSEREFLIDAGAFDGQVMAEFLKRVDFRFAGILAFEPDVENLAHLRDYVDRLPDGARSRIELSGNGVGACRQEVCFMSGRDMASFVTDKGGSSIAVVPLDDYADLPVSLVKLHIEGHELEAVLGARKLFARHRPIVAATLYHNADGIWRLPRALMYALPDYRFHIRAHAWCGISTILYALPKERAMTTGE